VVEKDNQDSIVIFVLTILLAISTTINVLTYLEKVKARAAANVPQTFTEKVSGPSINSEITTDATVKTGGTFKVVLTVRNNGNFDLKNVMPSAPVQVGSARAKLVTQPDVPAVVLKSDEVRSFTWIYSADTIGTVEFKSSVAAENMMNSKLVSSVETRSNLLTVFPQSVK
jgi:hypothetical protein